MKANRYNGIPEKAINSQALKYNRFIVKSYERIKEFYFLLNFLFAFYKKLLKGCNVDYKIFASK